MNDNPGYGNIPHAFFDFITFLTDALPLRSVPTFIELFIGAMLTQPGFVTHAWLAINPLRHWTTYYKWVEYGKWSWVNIARRLMRMLTTFFPEEERFWLWMILCFFVHRKRLPAVIFTISTEAKKIGPYMYEVRTGAVVRLGSGYCSAD